MTRSIVKEIFVHAPPDVVWRALTDGEELARWFPSEARIEPRPGGSIWLSWGDGVEGTGTISTVVPDRQFGWIEARGLAIDFHLETRSGGTGVRLVHSGFGPGAEWDDEFHMTSGGWAYFLENLRWYLERHRGEPRQMIVWRQGVPFSRPDAYARLISALAALEPKSILESRSTQQLGLTVASLNDAIVFVEIEPAKEGARAAVWLSTYGLDGPTVDAARQRLTTLCQRAFAQ